MREIQGEGREVALEDALATPMAEDLKAQEIGESERRVTDPEWVHYSSQFYRRRWTVPALAAGLEPVVGEERSLEQAALIGWMLLAPALFLLLRTRFSTELSAGAALFCALLPPVLSHGHLPVTDSWGLTLLVLGLLLAWLSRRDLGWLPVWIAAVVALSLTRDLTAVLVIATGWVAIRERSRRMALIAGTGLAASLPVLVLFDAPLRESLAYTFNDFRIPTDDSWGWIFNAYPAELVDLLRQDAVYPGSSQYPAPIMVAMGVVVLAGLYCLVSPWRQADPFICMIRASAVAGILTILVTVNYTGLRLEMVFVPAIAVGLALLAERLLGCRVQWARGSPEAAARG